MAKPNTKINKTSMPAAPDAVFTNGQNILAGGSMSLAVR